jgi:ankyrin repeat protein
MVRVLLDRGENANSEDDLCRTPLHLVVKGSSDNNGVPRACVIQVARLLLEHGADINAQDKDKTTPLHLASYYGNLAIVPALIYNGANVSAKNSLGQTPLHKISRGAVCFSEFDGAHWHVVELLVGHGAEANVQDSNGATPSDLVSKTGCQWLTISESRFQSKLQWSRFYDEFSRQCEESGWHVSEEID